MKYKIHKTDAAVDQLDWAIRLFLEHSAYIPAITLAGAAEEILGESLGDAAAFRQIKKALESDYSLPGTVLSQQYLNRAKNWLKHWKDMKDTETAEIELETEAIQYIVRAIANLNEHDQSVSSQTPRFFEWLQLNKPELQGGL